MKKKIHIFFVRILYQMNIFHQDKLYEYIETYTTDEADKKLRGCVFTNIPLTYTMTDLLPAYVWKDPNLKWLDPGTGIGNLLIVVYFRLMEGLTSIRNINQRRKHIIENMLFFVELDISYIDKIKQIFCADKYKLNIFNGSFVYLHTLDENIPIYDKDTFGISFDIIIGNPPYQKPNMKDNSKLSTKPLYHLFVENSIKFLKEDGLLLFIHPISWRRKSKEIKIINEIINRKLIYIYTNNCFKEFGLSAPFINYYLLQNRMYDKDHMTKYKTIFNNITYTGELHIQNDLEYIPVMLTNHTMNIFNKVCRASDIKFDVQLEAKLSTEKKNISKEKNSEFKYLNLHTYSKKKGYIYRYSNKLHPSYNKLKILMIFRGGYDYLCPFIDKGTMGITDNSMRLYVNDKNKDNILHFLKSKLFMFLLMTTTYNYGANRKNEFHIINTFSVPEHNDYYTFYNINEHEKNFIENICE